MNIPLNDNYIAVLSAQRGERGKYEKINLFNTNYLEYVLADCISL